MEFYTYLRKVTYLLSDWKTSYERRFWQSLKDRLCHLIHWLNIILLLKRISQESINLERKSYLDCSSDTLCTRWASGRVTYWLHTLRSWRRWTHRKSTRKDSMRKRWYFQKNIFFQSQMDEPNSLEEIKNWEHPPWHCIVQFKKRVTLTFLESEGSLPSSLSRDFIHHQSRWIQSQTFFVERRIIPYSTEIHWRFQNYAHKFRCQAREAHRWLLEYRWLSRLVWSLDKFHTIYSTGKNLLIDFCDPGRDWKESSNIEARSFLAWNVENSEKKRQAEDEAKVVTWNSSTQQCVWMIHYQIFVFQQKRDNSVQHYNLVHKFIPMPQALIFQQRKQQWTRNGKNWRKFRRGTWRKSKVRKRWSMTQGRRTLQFIFASLMEICHLKNAELEAKHQKYKSRVVLRGDIVKDDTGSFAVFTEQGSSASQMTAAKSWISSPDCRVAMVKEQMQYLLTPMKNGGYTQIVEKFKSRNVQTFGFVYHDTNGQNHGPVWKTQSFLLSGICMIML